MYATQADVAAIYGQDALTVAADRDGDGAADPGVADEALTQASELMDSFIGSKYALPLPSVPAVLRQVCVDIALYKLAQRPGSMTEEIKDRNDAAMRWLRDLADGRVTLGIDQSPPSAGGGIQVVSNPRRMTRDKLWGV